MPFEAFTPKPDVPNYDEQAKNIALDRSAPAIVQEFTPKDPDALDDEKTFRFQPDDNTPENLNHLDGGPVLELEPDQNMPKGVVRYQVRDYDDMTGNKENIGSMFVLEKGKAKVRLLSNDLNPELFPGGLPDYAKATELLAKKGKKFVIGFAGPYRAPNGNIEGCAIESGVHVGEANYSKWAGFVYMSPTGGMELYRCKDASNNFDKAAADNLVARAIQEKGSLYQQIPAIWNGKQLLSPTSQQEFEMRAIVQLSDGSMGVLNFSKAMTQDQFLKKALALKDAQGNQLVRHLMLCDTGACSTGAFTDNDGNMFLMVDENAAASGHTNMVVVEF